MHVMLAIGDSSLTGADVKSDHYVKPSGFEVLLNLDDPERAERIFSVLAEEGVVHMSLQQTFWALRYGKVVDRFGTPWTINCGSPGSQP